MAAPSSTPLEQLSWRITLILTQEIQTHQQVKFEGHELPVSAKQRDIKIRQGDMSKSINTGADEDCLLQVACGENHTLALIGETLWLLGAWS